MDWTLRELTPADLHNGFLEALASLAAVDLLPWQAEEVFRQRLGQGVRTYVAVHRQQVVGTASLLVERKYIHRGGLVGHIEDVAVHRGHQLRGVGTALVGHATEEARRLGCYKVILDCSEHLIPFYERLGYRPHNFGLRIDF
jgi:glucosamine-phosphate N-acetyltransferase